MARYARGFVRNGVVLELLYHPGHGKSASFCSWIPDFMGLQFRSSVMQQRTYPPTISTWKTRRKEGFYAGLGQLPWAEVLDNPQGAGAAVLAIHGYLFGDIKRCSELGLDNNGIITFAKALRNVREYINYLKNYPDTDGNDTVATSDNSSLGAGETSRDKLLLQLLVGDSRGPQTRPGWADRFSHHVVHREEDDEEIFPWAAEMGRDILSLGLDEDAHEYTKKPAEAQARIMQYWQTAWTFMSRIPGAALCITRNRRDHDRPYAGIVPGEAKAGDRIFIANGGKVPFVLREVREVRGSTYYKLIGECYIHGIMYGMPSSVQHEDNVRVHII
ncbi:hypothetical protein BFJ68_g17561 [Fusarium oxysporum]|uniref:Heterokaryon incompatibility domain-containing protein n=1 Tax=Fusarium oxysporum TaxID=5507 RepID=A0A420NE90_FUSOX|nr:hypothetical protein FOMA001_g13319 [Fusarium oxysporum f. sp. matthiolae]RKK78593.1 hypothetical protein BFJ71_g16431 [Fusarium oxysporum]RKK82183.1 hypothetical protein BFJ68_g17561 [Fusarium oxysporum]